MPTAMKQIRRRSLVVVMMAVTSTCVVWNVFIAQRNGSSACQNSAGRNRHPLQTQTATLTAKRSQSWTRAMKQQQPTSLETFLERRERLRKACSDKLSKKVAARSLNQTAGVEDQQKTPRKTWEWPANTLWLKTIAFCSLPKTGSTFWKRILYYLDQGMSGPLLSHDFGDIHSKTKYLMNKRFSTHQNCKKIVFVREPYTRLFSAYVDKLFKPSRQNWVDYGRRPMRYSRPHASRQEKNCSHNVTFAEFVHYFIHTELKRVRDNSIKRDEHFVPVSQHCGFCTTSFDFIGRQETFAEDTLGILTLLNNSAMLTFSDFDTGSEKYEMDALIRYTYEHQIKRITESGCMTKEEVLRRLWKIFQIRGTFGAEEFFPFSSADALMVTKETFLLWASRAHNQSFGIRDTTSNKVESMLEAYSSVALDDRVLLRQIFKDDFAFFDYNPNHPLVFPSEDLFVLPYYRFFDVYDSFLFTHIAT